MADSSDEKKPSGAAKFFGYVLITIGVFILLGGGCFIFFSGFTGWLSTGVVLLIFGILCMVAGVLLLNDKGAASSANSGD